MGYSKDRAWSDRFIPEIISIVGSHLLIPAPDVIDQRQATDLIVLTARNMTIAARVRRPGYKDRYPYEFTIRSERDSGAKTELEKVIDGWADWMFYGHASEDETQICQWFLIDLHSFRSHMIRNTKSRIRMGTKSNGDGTYFKWFDLRTFPPNPPILIASSDPMPIREELYGV